MSRIVVLIDESGSMHNQKSDVVDGINTMINSQRKLQETNIMMDIIKFNTQVNHYISKRLSDIPCFTLNDYEPNGMTSLYDAVGIAINKYKNETGVTMIITTDGMENSSREYKLEDMKSLINEQEKTKNWKFIYLSEDPTTVKQGYSMGFHGRNTSCQNVAIGRSMSGKIMKNAEFNTYIGLCSQNKTDLSYEDWQKL